MSTVSLFPCLPTMSKKKARWLPEGELMLDRNGVLSQ